MPLLAAFTLRLVIGTLSVASIVAFSYSLHLLTIFSASGPDLPASAAAAAAARAACNGNSTRVALLGDGCYHVYLDLGTNIGIQLRKLYEPWLYPGSLIEPKFQRYFGSISSNASALEQDRRDASSRRNVCAFGFEPNPRHTSYLLEYVAAYSAAGYRVHVATETAVGTHSGMVSFRSDGDLQNNEWAGTVREINRDNEAAASNAAADMNITLLDFNDWLQRHILPRRLPVVRAGSLPPAIVMKIDIEGDDQKVFAHLMRSGALCYINYSYVEHVEQPEIDIVNNALKFAGCEAMIDKMDDEIFHNQRLPFQPLDLHTEARNRSARL